MSASTLARRAKRLLFRLSTANERIRELEGALKQIDGYMLTVSLTAGDELEQKVADTVLAVTTRALGKERTEA